MKLPGTFRKFYDDFKNKEFIAVKLSYFCLFGGLMIMFPFLTIHARSLGIQEDELGIIFSLLIVSGLITPTTAGIIADRIGNFKVFMIFWIFVSGLVALPFMMIPYARITHNLPQTLPVNFNCTDDGTFLTASQPYICEFKNFSSSSLRMKNCTLTCQSQSPLRIILETVRNEAWCKYSKECDSNSTMFESVTFENIGGESTVSENEFIFDRKESDILESASISIQNFCPSSDKLASHYQYKMDGNDENAETSERCWLECLAEATRDEICSNEKSVQVFNPAYTVAMYAVVRVANAFALGCSMSLMESASVLIVTEAGGDIGFQKVYINFGHLIFTPISGKMIDIISDYRGFDDYSFAFYAYFGVKVLCCLIILPINLECKKPSPTILKDFGILMRRLEIICFMVSTAVTGVTFGFIDTFLFWLLEDLGGSRSLMGTTVTVGAAFGIPMLIFSGAIIDKLGHINTLAMGLGIYVIRLMGYAFLQDPWMAMFFEALEGVTVSLVGVVAVSYIAILTSTSTIASLQGLYSGTHYSLGRGLGSFMGGFLIRSFGIRNAFLCFAVACGTTSALYLTINFFYLRKITKKRIEDNLRKTSNEDTKEIKADVDHSGKMSAPIAEEVSKNKMMVKEEIDESFGDSIAGNVVNKEKLEEKLSSGIHDAVNPDEDEETGEVFMVVSAGSSKENEAFEQDIK